MSSSKPFGAVNCVLQSCLPRAFTGHCNGLLSSGRQQEQQKQQEQQEQQGQELCWGWWQQQGWPSHYESRSRNLDSRLSDSANRASPGQRAQRLRAPPQQQRPDVLYAGSAAPMMREDASLLSTDVQYAGKQVLRD